MKDALKKLLGEALTSKKLKVLLATVLAWVIGLAGLKVPPDTLLIYLGPVMGLAGAYLLGQGVADIGKPAAQVNQETALKLQAAAKQDPQ